MKTSNFVYLRVVQNSTQEFYEIWAEGEGAKKVLIARNAIRSSFSFHNVRKTFFQSVRNRSKAWQNSQFYDKVSTYLTRIINIF